MRVLVVKTSSLGDIIHTLPALSDALRYYPEIQFDWVAEESMQTIPSWHKAVHRVIPVSLRRWRKNKRQALWSGDFFQFIQNIRQTYYDVIIDAQGLLKSAMITMIARGDTSGLDWNSAREPWSSLFYSKKSRIPKEQHAVERVRALFAESLNYPIPNTPPDYGICVDRLPKQPAENPYFVLLHGTTWATKHWPEQYWIQLGNMINQRGYPLKLMWGNTLEHQRALRIQEQVSAAEVLPKLTLEEAAGVIAYAKGVVAVDTGLGHLAAALHKPTVSVYGPTDPIRTGTYGLNQIHLKAEFNCSPCFERNCHYSGEKIIDPPCFTSLPPIKVMASIEQYILQNDIPQS